MHVPCVRIRKVDEGTVVSFAAAAVVLLIVVRVDRKKDILVDGACHDQGVHVELIVIVIEYLLTIDRGVISKESEMRVM